MVYYIKEIEYIIDEIILDVNEIESIIQKGMDESDWCYIKDALDKIGALSGALY